MTNWFYSFEGKQQGPFSAAQFRDLVTQGVIRADTLVWTEGMPGWQRASEIQGLLPAASAPAIQPRGRPALDVTAPAASSDTGYSRPAIDAGGGEFRIGIVLSQTIDALKAKLGTFLLITLIPILATIVVVVVGVILGFGAVMSGGFGAIFILATLAMLLLLVVFLISQAMTAYGTFQTLSGRNFSFGDAFQHTSQRIMPIVGASLLMSLAAVIVPIAAFMALAALAALTTPAVYWLGFLISLITIPLVMTVLFVTIPACTIEPLGSVASLSRSADLTKGYRWQVFGLILIAYVGTAIVAGVLSFIVESVAGVVLGQLVNLVLQFFILAFNGVLPAAIYLSLRRAKEGIDVGDITSVFE